MNDNDLINLYLERSEEAIKETVHTYGAYCNSIALRILGNAEDAEECMSDVCLRVWNAIPPESPRNFKGWLGTITRNCAITLCRKRDRERDYDAFFNTDNALIRVSITDASKLLSTERGDIDAQNEATLAVLKQILDAFQ